jgi:hypothetical protein
VVGMTLAGYLLGATLGDEIIGRWIHVIVGVVILLSLLPPLFAWLQSRRASRVEPREPA